MGRKRPSLGRATRNVARLRRFRETCGRLVEGGHGQDLEDPVNESIEVRVGLTEEEMTHPPMFDQETGGKKRQLASGSDATRVVKRSRLDVPRSVGALDGADGGEDDS